MRAGHEISRRRFTQGAVVATGVWAAPSVIGLDRVAAAIPSVPYTSFYTENFQGAIGGPNAVWSSVLTDVAPADASRRFLGQFNNDTITLAVGNLPAHSCVCIEFDLYIIQSWDGENAGTGPDVFNVQVDGSTEFSESFAHQGQTAGQSFGPAAINPGGTGATELDTLGYPFFGDAVYRISLCDLAHTASTMTVAFIVNGLQAINDESWGIDNLEISTV